MLIRFTRAQRMSSEGPPGLRRALNHLAGQRSPYLQQHQENPVDWYPWGPEALDLARRLDKPLFLSIGYSTCHWCHVMERECFASAAIARQLNEGFVAIKIDREERPDLDRQFMAFVQAITGHGGWPLSVFLTPKLTPFFGGTYFPPQDSGGMPGLPRLLATISKKWAEGKEEVERSGGRIVEAIRRSAAMREHEPSDDYEARMQHACNEAFDQLAGSFDRRYGGFGGAPKFPTPSQLELLLRVAHNGNAAGRAMLMKTLEGMALGGIRDHLEGGFRRYTVDQRWHLPHFEKMLYDQGQLMRIYASAYAVDRRPLFKEVLEGIHAYVTGHLCSPDGSFYCAEDADSVNPSSGRLEEGALAVWSAAEIKAVLRDDDDDGGELYRVFCACFGVREEGNVDPAGHDAHGVFAGKNVLDRLMGEGKAEDGASLAEAVELMQKARATRPRPHLDDKVLTAWNGLMISGLCRAYRVLKEPRYLDAALRALDAIRAKRMLGDGLCRSEGIRAFGDDYAFLIQAVLDAYEITLDQALLQQAMALQDELDEACWSEDPLHGGGGGGGSYSLSRRCTERLLPLPDDTDGSEPSVNSVAYANLTRLALLGDDAKYGRRLGQLDAALAKGLEEMPLAMPALLAAFLLRQHPPTLIVIEGPHRTDPAVTEFRETALAQFSPDYVIRFRAAPRPSAHLCIRVCSEKIYSPAELARML